MIVHWWQHESHWSVVNKSNQISSSPMKRTLKMSVAVLVVTVSNGASLANRVITNCFGLTCCTSTASRQTQRLGTQMSITYFRLINYSLPIAAALTIEISCVISWFTLKFSRDSRLLNRYTTRMIVLDFFSFLVLTNVVWTSSDLSNLSFMYHHTWIGPSNRTFYSAWIACHLYTWEQLPAL